MDNENKKPIDGTKLALWLLKLQARLDNLERYALDTAEEMGGVFCDLIDLVGTNGEQMEAWLHTNCPGVKLEDLEWFLDISCLDSEELDRAGSISAAKDLVIEKEEKEEGEE